MISKTNRALAFAAITGMALLHGAIAHAGSIFVSGHDPDFHAQGGGNPVGAQNLIKRSLSFARDGNNAPILLLQTDTSNIALGDHLDSELGLQASGFNPSSSSGDNYVKVNATDFATIDLSLFSALFIPSDHGGTLTGNDLVALNARSADIIDYLNAGGGLVAWAEDGNHQPAVPGPEPTLFGFLPFLVANASVSQGESGFTLSPFGTSLGLTVDDINGNFSHTVFSATGGMTPVGFDADGRIVSLAFRGRITTGGTVPEPSSLHLLGAVVLILVAWRFGIRRRL